MRFHCPTITIIPYPMNPGARGMAMIADHRSVAQSKAADVGPKTNIGRAATRRANRK